MKTRDRLPYLALGALSVLLFTPFFVQGRVQWSQDIGRVYYPVAHVLREALRSGRVSRLLWCPELGGGFPLAADGVTTPFYPPLWLLLALLPPARALCAALFVGYLASGLAMAAFARSLGLSGPAATVAGLVYGWSGFAVGHAVHVNVVAGLPFLPLTLWLLERAAHAAPRRHVALAGVSFGLQCLGGHPQVALMSATVGVAYLTVRLWPPAWSLRSLVRVAGLGALFLAIGAGLSAVYYFPMAELSGQSVRPQSGLSHAQAVAYALPFPHLLTAVSPFLFFDARTGEYRGAWNPAEMALYAGLPTLLLAAAALASRPRDPLVRFFAAVFALALLLALGDATPLHGLLHRLPVFRVLRAPARYVLLVDLALAILAALGLERLRSDTNAIPRRRLLLGLGAAVIVAAGLPFAAPLWRGRLAGDGWRDAEWAEGAPPLFFAQAWLPLLWLALAALWLGRRPRNGSRFWASAGAALVAADLASFAATSFATHWVKPEVVLRPDAAHALAASSGARRTHILGGPEPWRSASDLPLILGFRSLDAYVSLPLARYAGYMRAFWMSDLTAPALLDAAAVTLVVDAWRRPLDPRSVLDGVEFSPRHPLVALGPGPRERGASFELVGVDADRLALVTALVGAAGLPQDAEAARVTLEATTGPPLTFSLRAGRETAERLPDATVAHLRPAPYLEAWSRVDRRSDGAFYLSRFAWGEGREIRTLRVEYTAPTGRLLLFGGAVSQSGGALTYLSPFMREGYRRVRGTGAAVLYENERARPRACVVHHVVLASTPDDAVSRLAAGEVRPEEAVILEDPEAPPPTGGGPSAVSIVRDEPTRVELGAEMAGDGYVVLADAYYPGWEATVDGARAPIYAADGLFRAVFVKSGAHQVSFDYRPRALRLGALVTGVSLALAAGLVLWPGRPRA